MNISFATSHLSETMANNPDTVQSLGYVNLPTELYIYVTERGNPAYSTQGTSTLPASIGKYYSRCDAVCTALDDASGGHYGGTTANQMSATHNADGSWSFTFGYHDNSMSGYFKLYN